MSYETVYKSLTDGHATWQIIKKNGVYHWRGSLERCSWCGKVKFGYKDVARLYSRYQFIKYGEQQSVYFGECREYHLTTSDFPIWRWTMLGLEQQEQRVSTPW